MQHLTWWENTFPEFKACPDASVKSLMASAKLVELGDGDKVFYPGMPCHNYLLLLDGTVKAFLLSANGREVLLYQVRPGDSCILTTSCLLGNEDYPAEGICQGPVKAFAIASQAFHRCLEHSAFFRDFVFDNFSARLSNVIGRMENVLFVSLEARLAQLLLAEKISPIRKTHQELANELGSAREVVSRQLKRFEKFGWVKLNRGQIEITHADALRTLTQPD